MIPRNDLSAQTAPLVQTRDLWLLGLLLLLVLPLRLWLLGNTEVAARDSIGYIRYALQFERMDWRTVLTNQDQHPGYPLSILAVSQPIRWWTGETDADTMRLSAQTAAGLFALILMIPMYFLGKALLDARAAFGGTLLYQYLPTSSQILSDGVSEPLFLTLVSSSLLFAVLGFQRQSTWRFGLAGLFCGLAYLTRPEGALIVLAVCLMLAIVPMVKAWRMPRWTWLGSGTAFLSAAILMGSVYLYATGRITRKVSPTQVIDRLFFRQAEQAQVEPRGAGATPFAASFAPTDQVDQQFRRSLRALVIEFNKGFYYVCTWPAFLGLLWSFGRLRTQAGVSMIAIYLAIHAMVLVALGMEVFYVSERHIMILVLIASYLAAVGCLEFPERLMRFLGREASSTNALCRTFGWALLAFVVLVALPQAAGRIHGHRIGNREAGEWLQAQRKLGDVVVDTHGWAHFYCGLFFEEGREKPLPREARPTCFMVLTRSRDPEVQVERQKVEDEIRAGQAKLVYHWPEHLDSDQARVVIYARPRDPAMHAWEVEP